MDKIKNYDAIHSKITKFANENSIPYLDFNIVNQKEFLLTNNNFRDYRYLNYSGVLIVDKYLTNWISNIAEQSLKPCNTCNE